MCVRMLNPKSSETMIDTAAGSCGFPVHTTFYVKAGITTAEYEDYVNEKIFAIDSDFYICEPFKNPNLTYKKIGVCLSSVQYGISIDMNEDGVGFPIYRMNEIHNQLCDTSVKKSADISQADFEKFQLNDGDVLFNRTNSYQFVGRTGIYYAAGNGGKTFASYLVRLVCDEEIILPEYLTAYLNTKYGVADVKRRARQSINQTNVNPEEVKEIELPILSKDFQARIRKNFRRAHDYLIKADEAYHAAERTLERALGLDTFKPSNDNIAIKTFSASFGVSGRLDAEFYQPKYDDWKNFMTVAGTVGELCKVYDKNFTPRDEKVYRYIELADVGTNGNISTPEAIIGAELPTRARRIVKAGQVIVSSIEGSLQNCALITDELDGALCSTGFFVIDSKTFNAATLLVLFKSELIQNLMRQQCTGTILTAVSRENFLNLPLPAVARGVQEKIAAQVSKSFRLRDESERLLSVAKRAVELAIEQGEAVATEKFFAEPL